MNSILRAKYIALSVSVFFAVIVHATPCGFAALKSDNKKIALIFDASEPSSTDAATLRSLPYSEAKTKFSPEEQAFLRALESLDHAKQYDLVWELCSEWVGTDSTFMTAGAYHIRNALSYVQVIFGDTARYQRFRKLFNFTRGTTQIAATNTNAFDYDNPVPVSAHLKAKISRNFGQPMLDAFEQLRNAVITEAHAFFDQYRSNATYPDEAHLFTQNEKFHSLAQIELLMHILASDNENVIAYVSPWIGERIVAFLKAQRFNVIKETKRKGNGLTYDSDEPITLSHNDLVELPVRNAAVIGSRSNAFNPSQSLINTTRILSMREQALKRASQMMIARKIVNRRYMNNRVRACKRCGFKHHRTASKSRVNRSSHFKKRISRSRSH